LGKSGRNTIVLSILAIIGLILFLISYPVFTDIGILRLDHSKTEIISQADSILPLPIEIMNFPEKI
jgi:riboflavin transporter FmnP